MKYALLITLFFVHAFAFAQVPPERSSRASNSDDALYIMSGETGKQMESGSSRDKGAGYYKNNGKYGFVYPEGVKQETIYDHIEFRTGGFIIKKGDLFGMADKLGAPIGKIEYDSIGAVYYSGFIVKKNGRYGTLSNEGQTVLSVKYHKILSFNRFVTFVQSRDGAIQMIANDKEQVFSSKIDYAALYDSVAVIKANGKYGVFKKQLVVPLEYDSIFISSMYASNNGGSAKGIIKKRNTVDQFSVLAPGTLITLQKDKKYGLADLDGKIIYPADNDAISNLLMYKYYSVKKGDLYGIYFVEGKKKTEIEFDRVYADGIGYVNAVKSQKSGVFDLQGKQIVGFDYDAESISQTRLGFKVTKNKKKGIVGKNGELLVSPIYDDVDPFYDSDLADLVKVKSNEKFGILNLKGEIIIPLEFEWIGDDDGLLKVLTFDRKFGLYDKKGKVIVPAEYQWINKSETPNSNMIVLKRGDNAYKFLNKMTKTLVFKEDVTDFGYVHNQDGLLNPFSSTDKRLIFVKGSNGKVGMLNESTANLDVPIIYDEINKRFDAGKKVYYSVRSGKKHGLVDEVNRQVIPIQYDAISVDLAYPGSDLSHTVVVAKKNKYGAVNLENQVLIPFQYDDLQRISSTELYKAKVGKTYQIINSKNEVISKGPFEEVANFEGQRGRLKALTFYNGKMRVIDEKGKFQIQESDMLPHNGYKTFDELKSAFIQALDSKDETLLKAFAEKIAPSKHILVYLRENPFTKKPLEYIQIDQIKEKYYQDLLKFKIAHWKQSGAYTYDTSSLTTVTDYTLNEDGFVTNRRTSDHAFGDSRFMEKLLRNAYKVNGYWISSYFMQRDFWTFKP